MDYFIEHNRGFIWDAWVGQCQDGATQTRDGRALKSGAADAQLRYVSHLKAGDILLHYILGVNAWAGWSTVLQPVGVATPSSDPHDAIYSHPIPLKREVWLSKQECVFTARAAGNWGEIDTIAYHRKPSFQRLSNSTAGAAIVELINRARGGSLHPDETFNDAWDPKRLGYMSENAKKAAGFKCQVCDGHAGEWACSMGISHQEVRPSELGRWFLHAHHIQQASQEGSADLRNLVSLCPNCHAFAGYMGESKFRKFLQSKGVPLRTEAT